MSYGSMGAFEDESSSSSYHSDHFEDDAGHGADDTSSDDEAGGTTVESSTVRFASETQRTDGERIDGEQPQKEDCVFNFNLMDHAQQQQQSFDASVATLGAAITPPTMQLSCEAYMPAATHRSQPFFMYAESPRRQRKKIVQKDLIGYSERLHATALEKKCAHDLMYLRLSEKVRQQREEQRSRELNSRPATARFPSRPCTAGNQQPAGQRPTSAAIPYPPSRKAHLSEQRGAPASSVSQEQLDRKQKEMAEEMIEDFIVQLMDDKQKRLHHRLLAKQEKGMVRRLYPIHKEETRQNPEPEKPRKKRKSVSTKEWNERFYFRQVRAHQTAIELANRCYLPPPKSVTITRKPKSGDDSQQELIVRLAKTDIEHRTALNQKLLQKRVPQPPRSPRVPLEELQFRLHDAPVSHLQRTMQKLARDDEKQFFEASVHHGRMVTNERWGNILDRIAFKKTSPRK